MNKRNYFANQRPKAKDHFRMIRKSFLMTLKPGAWVEYEKRHNPIRSELHEVLKSHGVHNYSIYLDRNDNRQLFAYAEIESEERWELIAKTEVCQRWWSFMKDLMLTNDDDSPVTIDLSEVFHID